MAHRIRTSGSKTPETWLSLTGTMAQFTAEYSLTAQSMRWETPDILNDAADLFLRRRLDLFWGTGSFRLLFRESLIRKSRKGRWEALLWEGDHHNYGKCITEISGIFNFEEVLMHD